jgi:hypothetical protein
MCRHSGDGQRWLILSGYQAYWALSDAQLATLGYFNTTDTTDM